MVNAYEKYKDQSVLNMTAGERLVRLYEEVVKQLHISVSAIEEKNITLANKALQKAQTIIIYLKDTLDMRYELSNYLTRLYDFFVSQISTANIKKDVTFINEIIPIVEDLKNTFAQGEKLARIQG